MKTWLLAGMLLVGVCLSSCSKKSQANRNNQKEQASSSDPTTKPAEKPKPAPRPRSISLDLGDKVKMRLALIPAGKFMMGAKLSPAEVASKYRKFAALESYYAGEHPQHEVTISKPFYMGVLEVTRPQWGAVMGAAGPWKDKKCDRSDTGNIANHVSWDDANKFCEAISKKIGKTVALPTEAQWEYACRAGSKSEFSFGDNESRIGLYAWYAANTLIRDESYPHPAGQKPPNFWGLCDMHGNASEWCRDWYAEKFYENAKNTDPENTTPAQHRVLRGGEWGQYPDSCRSAYRSKNTPTARKCGYGFRVVIAVDPSVK